MDVMNVLLTEIVRSLKELQLGFAGELTMSDAMDALKTSLYLDRIPVTWQKRAWPSLRPLASWLNDFIQRLQQLEDWQNNPAGDKIRFDVMCSDFMSCYAIRCGVIACVGLYIIMIRTSVVLHRSHVLNSLFVDLLLQKFPR